MAERRPLLGVQAPYTYQGSQQGYPRPHLVGNLQRDGYHRKGGYPQDDGYSQGGGERVENQIDDFPPQKPMENDPKLQRNVPLPTAPPPDLCEQIGGYHQMDTALLPPPYNDALCEQPPTRNDLPRLPSINEDQAKEALLSHFAEKSCWISGPASKLVVKDLIQSPTFVCELKTFTEERITAWAFEPDIGLPIDSVDNGPAPGPWDIVVSPSRFFQNSTKEVEVPHTASIKSCHDCRAKGCRPCNNCRGRGQITCHTCKGYKTVQVHDGNFPTTDTCSPCDGYGLVGCIPCGGYGTIKCGTCKGRCKLKIYIKLIVKWRNHPLLANVRMNELPIDLIKKAKGCIVFQEELPMVWPVNHFQIKSVNKASRRMIDSHRNAFPSEKIIRQIHRIAFIPVTEVTCMVDDKSFSCFVCGLQNKVHAPDFPTQSCCTVL